MGYRGSGHIRHRSRQNKKVNKLASTNVGDHGCCSWWRISEW